MMYWALSSSAPRPSSRPALTVHQQPPYRPQSPRQDSSGLSSGEESGYNDIVRPGEDKNIQEIDAESLIAPVISPAQSTALYRNAIEPSTPRDILLEEYEEGFLGPQNLDSTAEPQTRTQAYRNAIFARPSQSRNEEGKESGQGKKPRPFSFQVPSLQLPNVSLPSLPNVTLPSFSYTKNARVRSKTLLNPRSTGGGGGLSSSFFTDRATAFFGRLEISDTKRSAELDDITHPKLPLTHRRSSSTHSIHLNSTLNSKINSKDPINPKDPRTSLSRTISTTSSLGDDAKFLHVHSPKNARMKAIRDNFLDGLPTFEFPQLPQLAQFNPFNDADPAGATSSTPNAASSKSPALEALDTLTGDVVVLGGYRGSILRDKMNSNRRVWVPLKVGLNLRKVDLEVGLDPEDEERMHEKIIASGMLTHIGPVDIAKKLLKRLRSGADQHKRSVHEWGYDWRLSPELLSKRLTEFLETLPCNTNQPEAKAKGKGALVIAHSLGGLITRHAMNQRPELFSGVIFAGTPQTCVNILGPLRNGDSVLLNSKVFTAQVNFTLRTSYAFLPEDGQCFVDRNTGKPIPLDFFNVETWKEYCLSPCVSTYLPLPAPSTNSSTSVLSSLNSLSDSAILRSFPYIDKKDPGATEGLLSKDRTLAPQMASSSTEDYHPSQQLQQPQTQCTLPLSVTIPYLERTLAETLRFRRALEYQPENETLYPPMAVLYSKTSPTVRGARVDGVEGIKRADAYVDLLFGAGDGVCLARKAMLPQGYKCTKRVAVDRGHISLLGDLEGVGRCVAGIQGARAW